MTKDAVRAYYASFGEREWQRLTNPDDGTVEFALTKELLVRYLPFRSLPACCVQMASLLWPLCSATPC